MTLPYATPPTAVPGAVLPAASWNSNVRDSMEALAKPPRCMATRNASQAVGSGVVSTIVWTGEAYDTDNIWTAGANADKLIVPRDGLYICTFTGQFQINGTGARYMAISKNGIAVGQWHGVGNAVWYVGTTMAVIQPMVAGDYFGGQVYHTAGVALNFDITYPINMVVAQIGR